LFRYGKGIVDFYAEVANGALDFCVSEQGLYGSQVTSAPVDQGRFGPAERMSTEDFRVQPDARNPLGDEPRILP
jgi:hypothetical protein